ncbi:MAG: DMT family transporter [Xanthobacteraceae bacterium]|uniref:DMT family transporter n=1 Tax=Pseudolabrys sp. TaxID=1960880 RepID=UPI003D13AD83
MMTSREKLGLALGFAGVVLFGGTLPATRLAVVSFDPFFLSAARAAIAGVLGLATLIVTRRRWPPRQIMIELIVTGVFTIVGFPVLIGFAMLTVPASHGGVVLGIMPLATAVCAVWLTHERPSNGFWIASTIGGAIVLGFVFWRAGGFAVEIGDLYLLGVVAVGALGYTMSGRLSAVLPGWEVISWQVAIFLPLTVAASLWWWPAPEVVPTASALAGLVYVSLVSMFFAFFVFNAAMAYAGVSRIGQMSLLQPFVIVALSIPVNGEPFEPGTILFAAAVVATVMIGQRMRVKRAS